jgi:hypothetical protein
MRCFAADSCTGKDRCDRLNGSGVFVTLIRCGRQAGYVFKHSAKLVGDGTKRLRRRLVPVPAAPYVGWVNPRTVATGR